MLDSSILPLYSFIRLFVYSFDVIHTLGLYSWGIKIDAIPGRILLDDSRLPSSTWS